MAFVFDAKIKDTPNEEPPRKRPRKEKKKKDKKDKNQNKDGSFWVKIEMIPPAFHRQKITAVLSGLSTF